MTETSRQIEVDLDHPVIFFCDPENAGLAAPSLEGAQPVWSTPSCVAVRARHHVDGAVRIVLSSAEPEERMHQVFNGEIECPSRRLSVTSASQQNLLSALLLKDTARVRVWTDDLQWPSIIAIQIEGGAFQARP
jgi:hypothetical protein